jgi:hypothetical protein
MRCHQAAATGGRLQPYVEAGMHAFQGGDTDVAFCVTCDTALVCDTAGYRYPGSKETYPPHQSRSMGNHTPCSSLTRAVANGPSYPSDHPTTMPLQLGDSVSYTYVWINLLVTHISYLIVVTPYQGCLRWWVHEVKVDHVVDAHCLQEQEYGAKRVCCVRLLASGSVMTITNRAGEGAKHPQCLSRLASNIASVFELQYMSEQHVCFVRPLVSTSLVSIIRSRGGCKTSQMASEAWNTLKLSCQWLPDCSDLLRAFEILRHKCHIKCKPAAITCDAPACRHPAQGTHLYKLLAGV